jgi:hypothetical protein
VCATAFWSGRAFRISTSCEASSRAAAIRRLNNHPEEALALLDFPQPQ